MRLSDTEFKAMNNPVRRFCQRNLEFPAFKRMGLTEENRDILEIGCGSGYGAVLLSELNPKSYAGIDVMPEQIELALAVAQQHRLSNYEFLVGDATDLSCFPDQSKDVVVIFGILHHIPQWREAVRECYRVLRKGGRLFVEEPDGGAITKWDRVFQWGHPQEALFSLRDLEQNMVAGGFTILKRWRGLAFGVYAAQK
ncbi:class I SAM-dependent methyltransferase [Chloroflexota bacterium]